MGRSSFFMRFRFLSDLGRYCSDIVEMSNRYRPEICFYTKQRQVVGQYPVKRLDYANENT